MKHFAWMTDIHLNFLDYEERREFYNEIIESKCDGILISGDIAEARNVNKILREMKMATQMPIYFVLGNHDYYTESIKNVREDMKDLTLEDNDINWLHYSAYRNGTTAIIGVDGWADARNGDYDKSFVRLNDSVYIDELRQAEAKGRDALKEKMRVFADYDALLLEALIDTRSEWAKKIIILTHVPPFPESSTFRGEKSDNNFLPFYSSKATGDVLLAAAQKYPEIKFEVYCGHSHGAALYQPLDNLIVETGDAAYHHPKIQKLIEI